MGLRIKKFSIIILVSVQCVSASAEREFRMSSQASVGAPDLQSARAREQCVQEKDQVIQDKNSAIVSTLSFSYDDTDYPALTGVSKDKEFYSDLAKSHGIKQSDFVDKNYLGQHEVSGDLIKKAKSNFLSQLAGSWQGKKELWLNFTGHGLIDENGKWHLALPVKNVDVSACLADTDDKRIREVQKNGAPIQTGSLRTTAKAKSRNSGLEIPCKDLFVSMDDLLSTAKNAGVKDLLFISDSCFSAAAEKSVQSVGGINALALFASQADESAADLGPKKGGAFTSKYLAKLKSDPAAFQLADKNKDQKLSLVEVKDALELQAQGAKAKNQETLKKEFGDKAPKSISVETGASQKDYVELEQVPQCSVASRGSSQRFFNRVLFEAPVVSQNLALVEETKSAASTSQTQHE